MKRILKYICTLYYKFRYITRCRIHALSCIVLRKCSFEGKNALGHHTYFSNSTLGFASYIGNYGEFSNCKIGRFCSLGSFIRVVSANHPVDKFVSSHPSFYSTKYFVSYTKESTYKEHLTNANGYECEIGNDVWIGDNVLIKGGVTIGNGAIIGMGSVVIHDVLPYSVVAGVPAKVIRHRFTEDVSRKLLHIKWWDKPIDWIKRKACEFSNPESFVTTNYTDPKED
jgi:acetyltransferase-like isoleucine patch superfamily enzyme